MWFTFTIFSEMISFTRSEFVGPDQCTISIYLEEAWFQKTDIHTPNIRSCILSHGTLRQVSQANSP